MSNAKPWLWNAHPVWLKVEDGFIKSSIYQENPVLSQPLIVFCFCWMNEWMITHNLPTCSIFGPTMSLHLDDISFCSSCACMVKLMFWCFIFMPTYTLFVCLDYCFLQCPTLKSPIHGRHLCVTSHLTSLYLSHWDMRHISVCVLYNCGCWQMECRWAQESLGKYLCEGCHTLSS